MTRENASAAHFLGRRGMADEEVDLLKPGVVLKDRWEVIRRIQAGGMGAVYEVVDRILGKRRALKVMLSTIVTPTMLQRFRQEASIPGKVDSPNVVDVLEIGVDEGRGVPFLVMELLIGEDLGARLERGPLAPEVVVRFLSEASLALDCAHAADVVHRDLKPENIFVTKRHEGADGEGIKVLDFGIAKIVGDSSQARTTLSVGTPLYMSPEQILGDATIGPRSDIYSLGHVAFALLVGRAYWEPELEHMSATPFLSRVAQGASDVATARAARLGVALPASIDAWFAKATAPVPADRFESASELVLELAEALGVVSDRLRRVSRMSSSPTVQSAGTLVSTPQPLSLSAVRQGAGLPVDTAGTSVTSSARRPRSRLSFGPLFLLGATVISVVAGYWISRATSVSGSSARPPVSDMSAAVRAPQAAGSTEAQWATGTPAVSGPSALEPSPTTYPSPTRSASRVVSPASRAIPKPNGNAALVVDEDPLERR